MTYLGERELLVRHELDCSFIDIAGTVVVLGIYLFESSILKPYWTSALWMIQEAGTTHNTVDRERGTVSYVKHHQ